MLCLDAFHVVAWATEALDQVRREMAARLRAGGHDDEAAAMKGSRWALLKNPPNLTGDQRTTLAAIAKANGGLYRAYLLKEQLREIFACRDPQKARALLGGWIAWAQRCRLEPFVKLAKTIKRYRPLILNAVEHGLSNARSEATNTHLRLLTRRAYGYRSPEALIAMADLTRGGLCPPLPDDHENRPTETSESFILTHVSALSGPGQSPYPTSYAETLRRRSGSARYRRAPCSGTSRSG